MALSILFCRGFVVLFPSTPIQKKLKQWKQHVTAHPSTGSMGCASMPHEGHATSAKPAEMSGRAPADEGGQTWHAAPLTDDMEQLQQWRIPHERPHLVSEATSWLTPGRAGNKETFLQCGEPRSKLPQWARGLSYLTGETRQTGSFREWFISL